MKRGARNAMIVVVGTASLGLALLPRAAGRGSPAAGGQALEGLQAGRGYRFSYRFML